MRRVDRAVVDMVGIQAILDRCKTCHLAMIDGESPYVVPLSYGYELDGEILTLYFHGAKEGKKLDVLRRNGRVCFAISSEGELIERKRPCDWSRSYASVIGSGDVRFIEDPREKCRALTAIFARQTGQKIVFGEERAENVCVFGIVSTSFTGKRRTEAGPASV